MKIIETIKSTFTNTSNIKWIELEKIKIDSEFKSIFPQKEQDLQKILESLKNGYDPAFPVIVTKGVPDVPDGTLVEGHTRTEACKLANVPKLAYLEKTFKSRAEIIEFIYRTQMARRNLTEQEQYAYYEKMASLKKANGKNLKTDQQIADDLEISRRQIAKFKEVEKKAPNLLSSFKAGEISLNAAYTKMKSDESPVNSSKTAKVSKPSKKTYSDGYAAGIRYAIQEIGKGRTSDELLAELSEGDKDEYKASK